MGVVFTGLFALGLVMFSKVETDVHLNHILFGSLLGIERDDMLQAVISAGVTLGIVLAKRKDLLLYLFDAGQARAVGLSTTVLHYLLLALLAATIVAALQAVGIILTVAMLVTPGCIAHLLSDRFDRMLLIAVAAAVVSSALSTLATAIRLDIQSSARRSANATWPSISLATSRALFSENCGWAKRSALRLCTDF
jgi:ABC-type Mn2+/Zn2+ transport system permease subunit